MKHPTSRTDPQYRLPFLTTTRNSIPETIPCLSLWQPWASLMMICAPSIEIVTNPIAEGSVCLPAKSLETRSWKTPHRGPLLIHAARRRDEALDLFDEEPFYEVLHTWGGFDGPDDLPYGALIGLNRLDAIWRTEQIDFQDGLFDRFERAFGKYDPGRYAWHLPCPMPFEEAIPYRGRQGLFDVPTAILPANAKDALRRWIAR